jgi:hypothetical protein
MTCFCPRIQPGRVLPLNRARRGQPLINFILVGPIKGLTAHQLNRRRVVGNDDGPFVLPSCSGCGPGFPARRGQPLPGERL